MDSIKKTITAYLTERETSSDLAAIRNELTDAPAKKVYKALIELALAGDLVIDKDGIRLPGEKERGTVLGAPRVLPERFYEGLEHLTNEPLIGASMGAVIEQLNLPEPIMQRLRMAHINDIPTLTSMSEEQLLSIRGIGIGKVEKIKAALAEYDPEATLREEEPSEPATVTLNEWVTSLPDNRRQAMQGRLAGETLQVVGDRMDVTRERVRQIEKATLKKRPPLVEDVYRMPFDTYAFDEESFCAATGESAEVFNYLDLTSNSKRAERKPLSAIVDDGAVDESIRKAVVDGAVDTEVIFEGDQRILKDKRSIIAYLLAAKHGEEPVAVTDLLAEYEGFLREHGIAMEGRLDPTSLRAFGACVERYDITLPTQGVDGSTSGWIRAFDPAVDLDPLREALEQATAKNIECSAELLMREGPIADAARDAGIRNGTELHAVIARYLDGIEGLELGRSPMFTLGSASRDEQIFSLIKEMSPAGARELAAEYENRYGMCADTFAGTCLRGFESYLADGVYRYVQRDLSAVEENFVGRYLNERGGYAPFDELKDALLQAFPEEASALPGESLVKAGFRIVDNLVATADVDLPQAFEALIGGVDYFDDEENGFGGDIMRNTEFRGVLNKLLRAYEVVEYEPGFFLNVRTLARLDPGFTSADLADYTDKVIDFIEPGVPYSLKSLHEAGFAHKLETLRDEVGMGDRFFESVLSQGYVGGRLKRTNIEGVMLFCKTPGWFSSADVVERMVAQKGAMAVADLRAALKEEHGVDIPLAKLRSIVKRADLQLEDDIVRAR